VDGVVKIPSPPRAHSIARGPHTRNDCPPRRSLRRVETARTAARRVRKPTGQRVGTRTRVALWHIQPVLCLVREAAVEGTTTQPASAENTSRRDGRRCVVLPSDQEGDRRRSGRGLHSLPSKLNLRTFGNTSLPLELNLSTFGPRPRVWVVWGTT